MLTIAIPTFERHQILSRNLESLLPICPDNVEILVVDNASSDDTEKVCQSYAHNKNFRYHRNPQNVGARTVYNCLVIAKNNNILFLGDDDKLEPEYLAEIISIITKHPSYSAISFEESGDETVVSFPKGDSAIANCFMRSAVLPGLTINRSKVSMVHMSLNGIYPQTHMTIQACQVGDFHLIKSKIKIVRIDFFSSFNISHKGVGRPADYGIFERLQYLLEQEEQQTISKETYSSCLSGLIGWAASIWNLKHEKSKSDAQTFFSVLSTKKQLARSPSFLKTFLFHQVLKSANIGYSEKFIYYQLYLRSFIKSFLGKGLV